MDAYQERAAHFRVWAVRVGGGGFMALLFLAKVRGLCLDLKSLRSELSYSLESFRIQGSKGRI